MGKSIPIYLELIKRDWTQRRLAEVAGIHESTLSRIMRGRYVPDELEKAQIAKALGVSATEIFQE